MRGGIAQGDWSLFVPTPAGIEAVQERHEDAPLGVVGRNVHVGEADEGRDRN